jgi:hypothetical protein
MGTIVGERLSEFLGDFSACGDVELNRGVCGSLRLPGSTATLKNRNHQTP